MSRPRRSATSPTRSSACSIATARRSGPWAGLLDDEALLKGLRHMMTLARLRRAHADGAAPGQDLVLHAAHGRGGGELRLPRGARARRHELPDLSPGRAADRRRLSDGRHDVPDLLQRARPAEGPPAAGDVFVARARLLLDLGQPRHAVHPGGRLGDGLGDQGRHARSPPAGSATARPPSPTSTPRWSSPRPTTRRSCSTSSTTSGRSRPSRASPAAARAPSPRAASASASRRCASTATTTSPSTRWRNGRPSGRGAISGRRWSSGSPTASARIRPRTIPRPTGRRPSPTPGRSAIRSLRLKKHLIRLGAWSRGAAQAGRSGDPGVEVIAVAEGGRDATARCIPARIPRRATCSRTSTRRCRRTCAASASRRGLSRCRA